MVADRGYETGYLAERSDALLGYAPHAELTIVFDADIELCTVVELKILDSDECHLSGSQASVLDLDVVDLVAYVAHC